MQLYMYEIYAMQEKCGVTKDKLGKKEVKGENKMCRQIDTCFSIANNSHLILRNQSLKEHL